MFRVKRSSLVSEVWELSKADSVVLTGSPGVGKSWMIAQLIRMCRSEGRPHLPIAAEDFDIRSVDELAPALKFKTDIFSVLKGLGSGPVLLIDGLDALRGELSQRVFRELIRRVSHEVPTCSIIASIRTFDLQQSEQLQQLLFSDWPGRSVAKLFKQVVVPPFTDDDLDIVVQQVPGLRDFVKKSTFELKELLRIPFNLHIAANLIDGGVNPDSLSVLQSQIQLLDRYWRLRVEDRSQSAERKQVLRHVVSEMVENKSLSVPETVCDVGSQPVLTELQSDEILRQGVTGRISFMHNILFDYASARLLLDEEAVFSFVREDRSRTIFYRPTLSYFFRYVWFHDRQLFWKTALSFVGSDDLPERATIVPMIVVQEAANSIDDLAPLLESHASARNKCIAGLLRAVQTLGGLQANRRQLWLEVLSGISHDPDLYFVNEYMALLAIASETALTGEGKVIGGIADRLLRWIWGLTSKLERHQAISISDIGVARIFPILMKFAGENASEARAAVRELLNRFSNPSAGSHEAFWLAHEIKRVIDIDPGLAVEVYRRAFAHNEKSDETTSMGGSVVLTLTSTRRQDFSSALYGLQTGFSYFVDVAPIHAAEAATHAVESELKRERPVFRGLEDE